MCELLGISFNTPVSPSISFAGLLTQSHRQKNGWGLGHYPNGSHSAQIFKQPMSGATSPLAEFISAPRQLRSNTFIGHIRKSSCGSDTYDNTHPFNRFYCYREWLFAHNGTLSTPGNLKSKFLPLGQTDSEKAFCYLLGKMSEKRIRPTRRGRYIGFDNNAIAGIGEILQEINTIGSGPFNCIFTDGTYLFSYCDNQGRRNLYYLEREAPFQRTVMRDTDLEIDLSAEKSQDEIGIIVASGRLTDENWISFVPGQLKVWKNGLPVEYQPTTSAGVAHTSRRRLNDTEIWEQIVSNLNRLQPNWRSEVENFGQVDAIKKRLNGKIWNDSEIFEGLLKSVLSNNTDWSKIERLLPELHTLFDDFNLASYARLSEADINAHFVPWFKERRAASLTLRPSLKQLIKAAKILTDWSREKGSAENYFTSLMDEVQGDTKQAAMKIGRPTSSYKLPAFGIALAAEALRNIGFDLVKPDRHILRAAGSFGLVEFTRWPDRNGTTPPHATDTEILETMARFEQLAVTVGEHAALVDNAIWLLCAKSRSHFSNEDLKNIAYS